MVIKLKQWALVAEIAGALAVVLSVAYLALQVSDNNRLLRSQAHYNALSLGQRPIEMVVQDAGLAAVMLACDADASAVSAVDWERCANYYFLQFNAWEYFYYQNLDESIPPELWRGADAYFRERTAVSSGYARFWSELQLAFDEPFRAYVNAEFAERGK
jgi:hypothetical protein